MARIGAVAALLTSVAVSPAGAAGEWQRVGENAQGGVSGIAYEGPAEDGAGVRVLVVHDNKRSGRLRLSRVTHGEGSVSVTPLAWDGPEPGDLEAIDPIPGVPGEYLALTGRGIVFRLKVGASTAQVVDYTPLPSIGEGDDFEGFALVAREGRLAALWADRGDGPGRPATLYAASVTFAAWGQPLFGAVSQQTYRASYPADDGTRHVSDLAVTDSGRLLVSSAADAGDDGPFDSAVSDAGRVTLSSAGRVRIALATSPTVLGTYPGYKVEAVECLPDSADALLGTDDENAGGSVRAAPFC
ncbi:hypothetical protein [Streptomyces sp. NPDC056361]|uniref:hypothetical protein n=1 Tax=Streptomyces sp. NPDC056361 TaxID=3345795 RepID=UPI0035DE0B53